MNKEKKMKVTISLSEGVLHDIDSKARIKGLSRSAYITLLQHEENRRTQAYIEMLASDKLPIGYGYCDEY